MPVSLRARFPAHVQLPIRRSLDQLFVHSSSFLYTVLGDDGRVPPYRQTGSRLRGLDSAGFGLIEIAIVLLLAGIVLGFGLPAINRYTDDLALEGTTHQIARVLALTRDRAKATGKARTMFFESGVFGTDYRVEYAGLTQTGWTLPRHISYDPSGTLTSVTLTPDGRCSASGLIILKTTKDARDTVSVLSSGLFITR